MVERRKRDAPRGTSRHVRLAAGTARARFGGLIARGRGAAAASVFGGDVALDVDDLAAPIVAITRDVVTQMGFTGGRIGGQLLGSQCVVGTAHAAAGRGFATFLDSHWRILRINI